MDKPYYPVKFQIPHYYGDVVRRLFLVAGVTLALAFPFFSHLISLSPILPLIVAVALVFLAGYTSPLRERTIMFDVIVSAAAVMAFGWYAFLAWSSDHEDWHRALFFFILSGLTLVFVFALYYSVKSLRGMTGK